MESYLALFEPDHEAGGYVVTLPDFGYGATQGETMDELRADLREAVEGCLAAGNVQALSPGAEVVELAI